MSKMHSGCMAPSTVGAILGRMEEVVNVVADYYCDLGVTPSAIMGDCRPAPLAWARQVSMFLSTLATGASSMLVGKAFGGKDHSTVLYACRLVRKRMREDLMLKADVQSLGRQLGLPLVSPEEPTEAPPPPVKTSSSLLARLSPNVALIPFVVDAKRIMGVVARAFDIKLSELKDWDSRPARIVFPRQVAMYLCREINDYGIADVAMDFGDCDTNTVLHACRVVPQRLSGDAELAAKVEALRVRLLPPSFPATLSAPPADVAPVQIDIAQVKNFVALSFDVSVDQINGPRQLQRVVFPRQVSMHLYRTLTECSAAKVGEAFGGMHHGTVLNASKIVKLKASRDPRFGQWLQLTEGLLRQKAAAGLPAPVQSGVQKGL